MSSLIANPTSVPAPESFSLHSLSLNSFLPKLSSPGYLTAFAIIAGLLILEQSIYRSKKAHLPGPKWTIPIIGKFADSVSPTLEKYKSQWASGDLSAVSVFNIFIVMAASNEYSRKIFNSPAHTEPCLVASMKQVLLHDNWVFLTGKAHVEYRKVLNTLFTRRALSIYLSIQDEVTRKYFNSWLAKDKEDPTHKPIMMTVRDLNMEASLRVFCGSHIPEHACREISDKYWQITAALELVNFPLALPGTKVYGAIQARKVAMKWLESAAAKSKLAMVTSGEPECLVDAWVLEMKEGRSRQYTDREIAMVILSFLFASQDAMSSGLIYLFQHLADHPQVLAKVRQEQERIRAGDFTSPVTLDMMDQMTYLKAVVKESLRLKPPVTMVPYIAKKDFPISEDYTVPAGSIVIPALYPSLHDEEVYPEPASFIPERWLDENSTANLRPQNFMVFGAGPHKCIGVEYTYMHLACSMGNAAVMMNWDHLRTDKSEGVDVIATIFPKDGCLLKCEPR